VKTTSCSSSCTWFDEQADSSIHGQWLKRTSTLSNQDYGYDQAGRLTQVDDTPAGQACTQRRYGYDRDSNRTGQVAGASCANGTGGTTTGHSYDEADRLTDTATSYDKLGNTTALAAGNAGGYAITSTYYADDRLHTQTQAAITETQDLDPARRIRALTVAGQTTRTDTYHYADDSDSPAWISSSPGGWTRNIQGPTGDLVATQDSTTGTTTLQISNLHGDIIATATTSPGATGLSGTQEQTEFGEPRTPSLLRYGYLGAKARQLTYPWGTIQMGARTYIPQTGRFLQTDPITGGCANAYDYVHQDPLNRFDLDGRMASCASFDYRGNYGSVHVQVNPRSGSLHWGINLRGPEAGHWTLDIRVSGKRVDRKNAFYLYAPHGSLPARLARPGRVFRLSGFAVVVGTGPFPRFVTVGPGAVCRIPRYYSGPH